MRLSSETAIDARSTFAKMSPGKYLMASKTMNFSRRGPAIEAMVRA